jgi:hypothetical protein
MKVGFDSSRYQKSGKNMIVVVTVVVVEQEVCAVFTGRARHGTASLIVNRRRYKGRNINRKIAFNSSRCPEAGKKIIVAVGVVVVEQKKEGLIRSIIVGMT